VKSEDIVDYLAVIEDAARRVAEDGLLESDAEDVVSMLGAACNTWFWQDVKQARVLQVEEKFTLPLPGSWWQVYGTPDLLLEIDGRLVLRDWKTVGKIDEEVKERYRRSWQKKIYCWATGAEQFIYCLIKKPEARDPTIGLEVAEVVYTVENRRKLEEEVERYLQRVTAMIEAQQPRNLLDDGPWLTHSPHACNAYGRPCPRQKTCPAFGNLPPAGNPRIVELNNSGAESFLLCPERYRQSLILKDDLESSGATRLGSSFHLAMSRVYGALKIQQDLPLAA
jgi:hypothetical protein